MKPRINGPECPNCGRALLVADANRCLCCGHDLETLEARLERLRSLIESSRFALTESDVRHDFDTGRHRYA